MHSISYIKASQLIKTFMENKIYYIYEIYDCLFANYILEQMGTAIWIVEYSCLDSEVWVYRW